MNAKSIYKIRYVVLLLCSAACVSSSIFAKKKSDKKKALEKSFAMQEVSPENMLQQEQVAIKKALKDIYEPSTVPLRPLEDFLIPIGKNFEKLPFASISETRTKLPAITLRPQFDIYIRGLQHRIEALKRKLGKKQGKDYSFLGDQRIRNFDRKSDQKPASAPKKAMSILPNIIAKVLAKVISDQPSDPIPELNNPLPFVSVIKSASYLDMLRIIRNLQQRMAALEAKKKDHSPVLTADSKSVNTNNKGALPIPELYEPLPWVPMATVFGAELLQAGALATLLSGPLSIPVTLGAAATGVGIMAAAKKLSDHQRTIYLRSLQQELLKLEQLTAGSQLSIGKQEASEPLPGEEQLSHKPAHRWGKIKPSRSGMRVHHEIDGQDNVSIDLLIEAAESAE